MADSNGFADTVLFNGHVFGTDRPTTAVAIADGAIVATGNDQLLDLCGAKTERIDMTGGTLLPGFQDAHVHPVEAGLRMLRCDLSRYPHRRDDYLRAIAEYATTHDGEWVIGAGWFGDAFPGGWPSLADLDAVVPAKPAVLSSHDAHGVWVNSAALRRAGIDDTTPDPPGGRIHRNAAGRPTGVLVESAADLVTSLVPPPSGDLMARALLEAQHHLHSVGVTGWQDAIVGPMWGTPDNLPTYLRLVDNGQLTAHVVGALWWHADRGLEQIDELRERRALGHTARFRATSVKIMQDGICENCTGAMLHPYLGNGHGTGHSFIEPDMLAEAARLLDADGFQIHMHAVGDRAVRECLDALAAARQANPHSDNRHQIAHVDVVHPDDVPRFAELGVIANIQALWARRDREIVERKLPLLGQERERWHFPFGSLARAGARLAMGSDWPVTAPDPLWAIHTAVHRTGPPEDPHAIGEGVHDVPLLDQERIDLPTAIEAYTAGSAYANHSDRLSGTIERGKRADLVLLDRTLDQETISAAVPVLTLVEGDVVYRAEPTPDRGRSYRDTSVRS